MVNLVTVPLDVLSECCTSTMLPEIAFSLSVLNFQTSDLSDRQGEGEMSATRPYVTDPFLTASQLSPLKHTLNQMAYIYISKWNRFLFCLVFKRTRIEIKEKYACAFVEKAKI